MENGKSQKSNHSLSRMKKEYDDIIIIIIIMEGLGQPFVLMPW